MAAASSCRPPDDSPLDAVLGIFSSDGRAAFRREIRSSWMPEGRDAGIEPWFVMRQFGASKTTLNESHEAGDIVFVAANASLGRKSGPLQTFLLWIQCATVAWPHARLIGKADDDVWTHLPSVAAHLRASLAALELEGGPAEMYWGMFENYRWDTDIHRPFEWGSKSEPRCKVSLHKTSQRAGRFDGCKNGLLLGRWRRVSCFWCAPARVSSTSARNPLLPLGLPESAAASCISPIANIHGLPLAAGKGFGASVAVTITRSVLSTD